MRAFSYVCSAQAHSSGSKCRHELTTASGLSCFGSRLTGRHRPGSDVDLLVESDPGRMPALLDMADMEQELGRKLGGLRVGFRTPGDLSRYFRDDALRDAAARYESR